MNVLVITDYNWDNFSIVSKKFGSLGKNSKINCLYGKKLQNFSNICSRYDLNLYRRSIDYENIEKSICKIIEYIDYCIVFHNFIEYNTFSKFIIDFCFLNNINVFTFSEHTDKYYVNGCISDEKFKKMSKISKQLRSNEIKYNLKILRQEDYNEKDIKKSIENLSKNYSKQLDSRSKIKMINKFGS